MENHEVLELLNSKFNKCSTFLDSLIFINKNGDEELKFLEARDKEYGKVSCTCADVETEYVVYVEKGVIFVFHFSTYEKYPEGPQGDARSMGISTSIYYFTRKSPLESLNNYKLTLSWKEMKEDIFKSLKDYQSFE